MAREEDPHPSLIRCQPVRVDDYVGIGLIQPEGHEPAAVIARPGTATELGVSVTSVAPLYRRSRGGASNIGKPALTLPSGLPTWTHYTPQQVPPDRIEELLSLASTIKIPELTPDLLEMVVDVRGFQRLFPVGAAIVLIIYENDGFMLIKRAGGLR